MSVSAVAAYRLNFILMTVQGMLNTLFSIASVSFVYSQVREIAGWNRSEMLVLVCTAEIISGMYYALIRPNIAIFAGSIRTGTFDTMLLQPCNIIYRIFVGRIDLSSLTSLLVPAFVLQQQLPAFASDAVSAILSVILVVLGLVVLSFLMLAVFSLTFYFENATQLEVLYYMFVSIASKPGDVFRRWMRIPLFYLLPVLLIANPAATVLIGKSSPEDISASLLISCGFIGAVVLIFRRAIRRYQSAGS